MSEVDKSVLNRPYVRFVVAVVVVVAALLLRLTMVRQLGAELPLFIVCYPAVMIAALLGGLRLGLLATVLSALLVVYWVIPPRRSFAIAKTSDAVALALFFGIGLFMSLVAEGYRRNRKKLAAYEKDLVLRESQAKLRQSEEQFETLANAIPQLCWMANADGWIFWHNQRSYEYTGNTLAQLEGWGWQSLLDPDSSPKVLEQWKASIATGEPFDMVFPLRGADGVFRPFLTRVISVKDAEGKVVRWFGTNTDISAQKKIEQALRESEERFRALVTATSDVVYRMSPDWSEMRQLRGRGFIADTETPSSTWLQEYIHSDDQSHVMAVINEAIRTKSIFELEHRVLRADGSLGWTFSRAIPLQDANGKIVEWFGAANDITERKQAEDALRLSEEHLKITLQSIGDAVISTDAAGKVVFMNAVAQKLTGWSLEESKGQDLRSIFNIVQEVTRIRPEDPVAKVIRLGKVVGLASHTHLIRRDRSGIPIDDSAAPIRGAQGQLEGVVLVFRDVSEQRKAERALRNAERFATGRLAASIAHEIHNPLDAVGNLLYLIDHGTKDESIHGYVTLASRDLARVTEITRQMLSFQREVAKPVPVRMDELLDSVMAVHKQKIEAAGIHVEKQVDHEDEILALPGELRQVFANLIGNAVEAIRSNKGKIRLRAYPSSDRRNGRAGLRVVVADNGPGIPTEVRAKIFEPFFTTKGKDGTGLGLWIAADIIQKYDGTMRLWSSTREGSSGTCFSVFLPFELRSDSPLGN